MQLTINKGALLAYQGLKNADIALTNSTERLSTGYKLNRAQDDPAGLAISRRMKAQIDGLDAANDNSANATSVIEIAEGALNEIQVMTQRISELSIKASNGVMTDIDREFCNHEVQELKKEITRIAETTEFNGQPLLNGNFSPRGYTDNIDTKVTSFTSGVKEGKYKINITGVGALMADGSMSDATATIPVNSGFPTGAVVTVEGNKITVTASGNFEINFGVDDQAAPVPGIVTADITSMGSLTAQIGSNEGQELDISIPKVSLTEMRIDSLDVSTVEGALAAVTSADEANSFLLAVRSKLGSYQNRLERTSASLDVTINNLTTARSRITDTDIAEEMTEYTKYQVMSQAATTMLAQANERPQQSLQLLQ